MVEEISWSGRWSGMLISIISSFSKLPFTVFLMLSLRWAMDKGTGLNSYESMSWRSISLLLDTTTNLWKRSLSYLITFCLSLLIGTVITLFKVSKVGVLTFEIFSQNLLGFSITFCLTNSLNFVLPILSGSKELISHFVWQYCSICNANQWCSILVLFIDLKLERIWHTFHYVYNLGNISFAFPDSSFGYICFSQDRMLFTSYFFQMRRNSCS